MNIEPSFTTGALANLATIVLVGLTLIGMLRTARRQNTQDTHAVADELKAVLHTRIDEMREQMTELKVGLTERVSKLERDAAEFMPRREIETKIEHERANRVLLGDAIARQLNGTTTDIRDIMVKVGGLQQRQDGHDQQMTELKNLVREGFREQNGKIDKLADAIREGKA